MNRLVLTNIRQNVIQYSDIQKKVKVDFIKTAFCFFALICAITFMVVTRTDDGIVSTASQVFNPISELYSDTSGVVFTSSELAQVLNKDLKCVVPIKSNTVSINNLKIDFKVDNSIMVMAIESGVIEKIAETSDGKRYIVIKHTGNITSVISGLDICGVTEGMVVARGKDIATAKLGETVSLQILENDVPLSITIEKSQVKWEQ